MKRVAALHDMSGVGKCSLTAAIPIISASGIECNPIPTAILSTHTGNIKGYTFRDLTDDLEKYCRHWNELGIKPDTIYTGYLGSSAQVEIVTKIISFFSKENTLLVVDPAMADSGVLYKGFHESFPSLMATLCKKADIIIPNITEACLMTGTEFREEYDKEYITDLVKSVSGFTGRYTVLTGVSPEEGKTGCCVYDKAENRTEFFTSDKFPGVYYGTGDIFASVLTSCVTAGHDCFEGAKAAVKFTSESIRDTYNEGTDPRFGVAFENHLSELTNNFGGLL